MSGNGDEPKFPEIRVFVTPEGQVATWHNLRHDVDAARLLTQGLAVVLAPKEQQRILTPDTRIVTP